MLPFSTEISVSFVGGESVRVIQNTSSSLEWGARQRDKGEGGSEGGSEGVIVRWLQCCEVTLSPVIIAS